MNAVLERRLAGATTLAQARLAPPAPTWATPIDLAAAASIDLDAWQRRVLSSTSPRLAVLGPRQSGKSTVSALLSLHTALTVPGALVLLIAPSLRQSAELARTVRMTTSLLGMVAVDASTPSAASMTRIEFPNGSRVIALPGTSEATVRGYAAPQLVVADEAARISEETFAALRPSLAASKGGRLLLLSTPWLKHGMFPRVWSDGSPTWERIRVRPEDGPRWDAAYIAEERRTLPAWVFSREYEGQFADDDQTMFTAELIQGMYDRTIAPLFGGST